MMRIKHLLLSALIATSVAPTWCMDNELSNIFDAQKNIVCARILQPHTGGRSMPKVAFHPNGKQLIISGSETKLWDIATEQPIHKTESQGCCVAIDREGKQYACDQCESVDKRFIKVLNPDTNDNKTLHDHTGTIWSLAFHPLDSTKLASGSADRTIKLWDIPRGTCTNTLEGHRDGVCSIAYSPDGRHLASGSDDGSIIVWQNAQKLMSLCEKMLWDCAVCTVAYNPNDSNQLASGNASDHFKIWDMRKGKSIFTKTSEWRPGRSPSIMSVAYKPDGMQIAYGKSDGTVSIVDVRSQKILSVFACNQDLSSIAYHPNGKQIACGLDNGTIELWNVE